MSPDKKLPSQTHCARYRPYDHAHAQANPARVSVWHSLCVHQNNEPSRQGQQGLPLRRAQPSP
eukprot:6639876-Karenia_brevis.AAC.1